MKYKTLTELGVAICDALREKLGTNESIQIQDVPEKIKEIHKTSGGLFSSQVMGYNETSPNHEKWCTVIINKMAVSMNSTVERG